MAMMPYAGSCGYWWWPFVHYKNKYGHFAALSRFMKGEDRRGKRLKQFTPKVTLGLKALGLRNDDRADVWVYAPGTQLNLRQPPAVDGARLAVPGLRNGQYTVELWDTRKGKVMRSVKATSAGGQMNIALPKVKPDLALKVRRTGGTGGAAR
jgi:hypothetical protein